MDVLAGVICGLVMGTILLGAGVYFVSRNRDIYDRLADRLPKGLTPTMVLLGAVFGIPPASGLLGIILGLIYNVIEGSSPDGGLGSSNYIFTLAILCITALVAFIWFLIRRRIALLSLIISLSFAGIFGWLLPVLAAWR